MNVFRIIFAELLGLFVNDWAFALLILLWVGLFASSLQTVFGAWAGPALFGGLAASVLIFVVRRAKR